MTVPEERMDLLAAQLHDASLMAAQIAETYEGKRTSGPEPTATRAKRAFQMASPHDGVLGPVGLRLQKRQAGHGW